MGTCADVTPSDFGVMFFWELGLEKNQEKLDSFLEDSRIKYHIVRDAETERQLRCFLNKIEKSVDPRMAASLLAHVILDHGSNAGFVDKLLCLGLDPRESLNLLQIRGVEPYYYAVLEEVCLPWRDEGFLQEFGEWYTHRHLTQNLHSK